MTGLIVAGTDGKGHYTDVTADCTFNPPAGTVLDTYKKQTVSVSHSKNGKNYSTEFEVIVTAKVVSWSSGTNEEIQNMVAANMAGLIDLTEVWAIGEEKTVHLSALQALNPVMPKQPEQDITLVLMSIGNYELADGSGKCAFVVGMKDALKNKGMISNEYNKPGGWNDSDLRPWCNETFPQGFPEALVSIFSEVKTIAADGPGTNAIESTDRFFPAAEKEVFGSNTYANAEAESTLYQYDYYGIDANKRKYYGGTTTAALWLHRSSTDNAQLSYYTNTREDGIPYRHDYTLATRQAGIALHCAIGKLIDSDL